MFTNSWPHDFHHPSHNPDMLSARLPGRVVSCLEPRITNGLWADHWKLVMTPFPLSLIRMQSFKSVEHVTATQVSWTLLIRVLFFIHQYASPHVNSVGGTSWWAQLSNDKWIYWKQICFVNVLHMFYVKCISLYMSHFGIIHDIYCLMRTLNDISTFLICCIKQCTCFETLFKKNQIHPSNVSLERRLLIIYQKLTM